MLGELDAGERGLDAEGQRLGAKFCEGRGLDAVRGWMLREPGVLDSGGG